MNRQRTGSVLNLIIFLFPFFWLCFVPFAFGRFFRIILCASFATTLNRIGMAQSEGVTLSPSLAAGIEITGRKIDSVSCERHTVTQNEFRYHQWRWQLLTLLVSPQQPSTHKVASGKHIRSRKTYANANFGWSAWALSISRLLTPSLAVEANPIFYCVTSI